MVKAPDLDKDGGFEVQEGHLGGCWTTGDPATWNPNVWDYFINVLGIRSVVDVGCGAGKSMEYFLDKQMKTMGIEGSQEAINQSKNKNLIKRHDYSSGPLHLDDIYDLAWTAEFIEHVEEQYIPNFVQTFKYCKYIAMTYAIPGQGGFHHVNEQHPEYWIEKMKFYGFIYEEELTKRLKHLANFDEELAKKNRPNDPNMLSHFARKGLVFRNQNFK